MATKKSGGNTPKKDNTKPAIMKEVKITAKRSYPKTVAPDSVKLVNKNYAIKDIKNQVKTNPKLNAGVDTTSARRMNETLNRRAGDSGLIMKAQLDAKKKKK